MNWLETTPATIKFEIVENAGRDIAASAETGAAVEGALDHHPVAVFKRCSAAPFDSDRDDERQHHARMLTALFDLRKERA